MPFPAAQSATAKGDPSNCKLEKNNFSGSEKLFFFKSGFEPLKCFILATCPLDLVKKVEKTVFQAKRVTHKLKKKTTFRAPKSCFFKSGVERPKCFILATCPFDLVKKVEKTVFQAKRVTHKLKKKTTFRSPKSCFFQKQFLSARNALSQPHAHSTWSTKLI